MSQEGEKKYSRIVGKKVHVRVGDNYDLPLVSVTRPTLAFARVRAPSMLNLIKAGHRHVGFPKGVWLPGRATPKRSAFRCRHGLATQGYYRPGAPVEY